MRFARTNISISQERAKVDFSIVKQFCLTCMFLVSSLQRYYITNYPQLSLFYEKFKFSVISCLNYQ